MSTSQLVLYTLLRDLDWWFCVSLDSCYTQHCLPTLATHFVAKESVSLLTTEEPFWVFNDHFSKHNHFFLTVKSVLINLNPFYITVRLFNAMKRF